MAASSPSTAPWWETGYDSVQLAAAHELHVNAEQTVVFASYDRRLNQAALLLQLEVLS
jgi:hypothetical protein